MILSKVHLLPYFGWVQGSKNFTAQKVRLEISNTSYRILEECRNQRVSQLRKSECKSQTPCTIFWRSVGIKEFHSSESGNVNLKHLVPYFGRVWGSKCLTAQKVRREISNIFRFLTVSCRFYQKPLALSLLNWCNITGPKQLQLTVFQSLSVHLCHKLSE